MRKKLYDLSPDPIPTFDLILPTVERWLQQAHNGSLNNFLSNEEDWLIVNRDLNGRVRLILPERIKDSEQHGIWSVLASNLMQRLGAHAYPDNANILFETSREQVCQGATSYLVDGFTKVWVVDRLATG